MSAQACLENKSSVLPLQPGESFGSPLFAKKIRQDNPQGDTQSPRFTKVERTPVISAIPLPVAGWVDAPTLRFENDRS
jgi:hypothetical protein